MAWIRYILCILTGIGLGALLFMHPDHGPTATETAVAASIETNLPEKQPLPPETKPKSPVTLAGLFAEIDTPDFAHLIEEAKLADHEMDSLTIQYMLMSAWAKRDPRGTLDYFAGKDLSEECRDWLLPAVFTEQGLNNLSYAFEWLEDNIDEPYQRNELMAALYSGIAVEDPSSAMAMVEQLPDGFGKNWAVTSVAEIWAEKDIEGAFGWLEQQTPSSDIYTIYQSLMYSYVEQNPDTAHSVINGLYPGDFKDQLIDHYAGIMAEKDPGAAMEWAWGLEGDAKGDAISTAIESWGERDFDAAYAFALDLEDEALRSEITTQLGYQLAYKDPAQLAGRLDEFFPAAQEQLVWSITQSWLQKEPSLARQWMGSLPAGALRDHAFEAAVENYSYDDPATAWELAGSISDPELRMAQISDIVPLCYRYNPAVVLARIENDGTLSPAEKETLIASLADVEPVDMLLPPKGK